MMEQTKEGTVQEWSETKRDTGSAAEASLARSPLRLLIIAPSHDILGGQSVHAAHLVKEFGKESALRISFLPINPRAPGFLRYLQRVKFVRTLVTSLVYFLKLLANIPRHDIIHVSSAAYTGFIISTMPPVYLGKLFRKKVVLNYHAGQAVEHLRDWKRTAIPTARRADAVVVPSNWLVDVFAEHGLKARAIFNHIELDDFHFRERKPLRPSFLSNRNFDPIYNVPCVLKSFAIIQKQVADASLVVVGDGAQRAELEELARDLKLRNVKFTGLVAPAEMPQLCDEADIYLNASNVDNMPLSILEAFAAGLPVVTTNAGGIPYMVSHEQTGLLVEKNDYEAMAAAAMRLLEDEELAAQMTERARAECAKYRWDVVREEWLDFYREVAGEKKL
ncbi:MAG TPA: glycosyltransferase family 4 protein [Pyrinomonadaceae bacterium]